MFVRISAAASTLMAGGLVFAMAGSTDVYEVVFKSTGIMLGTLIAIYFSGKQAVLAFTFLFLTSFNAEPLSARALEAT